jgi:hypothetical protein
MEEEEKSSVEESKKRRKNRGRDWGRKNTQSKGWNKEEEKTLVE